MEKKRRLVKKVIEKGDFNKAKRHNVFWVNYLYLLKNFREEGRPGLLANLAFFHFMTELKQGFPKPNDDEDYSESDEDDFDEDYSDDDELSESGNHDHNQGQPPHQAVEV